MTSRRDFLKRFTALASGIVLAPATALATVQRLGEPQAWVTTSGADITRVWRKVQKQVSESFDIVCEEYDLIDELCATRSTVAVVTLPLVLD